MPLGPTHPTLARERAAIHTPVWDEKLVVNLSRLAANQSRGSSSRSTSADRCNGFLPPHALVNLPPPHHLTVSDDLLQAALGSPLTPGPGYHTGEAHTSELFNPSVSLDRKIRIL